MSGGHIFHVFSCQDISRNHPLSGPKFNVMSVFAKKRQETPRGERVSVSVRYLALKYCNDEAPV